MKLLFDQNISYRVIKLLDSPYSDSKHVSSCSLLNAEDQDIWSYAKKNGFAILTFDSDFYDISLLKGHPPKIIWIRGGNLNTVGLANLLNLKQDIIREFLTHDKLRESSCLQLNSFFKKK